MYPSYTEIFVAFAVTTSLYLATGRINGILNVGCEIESIYVIIFLKCLVHSYSRCSSPTIKTLFENQ